MFARNIHAKEGKMAGRVKKRLGKRVGQNFGPVTWAGSGQTK